MPATTPESPVPRSLARIGKRAEIIGWSALLLTLAFTLGLWRYFAAEFEYRQAERFQRVAERQADAIARRMEGYQRVLRGTRGLFAASRMVTREEFHRYVEHLDLQGSLAGIQGTGFSIAVPRDRKAEHEREIRDEGFPAYRIRPDGDRDFYASIIYLEPFEGRNLRAFGYDMYSEPRRRAAMQRARDTGEPAMTRKVTLVQETHRDVQPGFLIYLPVYDPELPATTVVERRAALMGWVYSPFRANDLMGAVFSESGGEVEAMIFDGPPEPANLLFATAGSSRDARHRTEVTLDIAGRQWTVLFRSSESFDTSADRSQPNAVLLAGLLLSLVIGVVLMYETRHRRRLEAEVATRTAELVKARDDAESASRAKSAFLATVSHELRTPLNAIIGFSSILMQDDVTPEQRKQLAIVNRAGLQLLDLIREILDITSIEAGQVTIQPAPVPLRKLLEEQCEQLQPHAREAGLYLRLIDCEPSLVVHADASRLSQVVRNLVSNGLKFTDQGGVTVRCRRVDDWARIEIDDTGIGVPEEQRETLFNPFQRGGPVQGNRPGTGLGLAISRRLVEAMGGAIGFESSPQRGSRFWFTVPLAQAEAAEVGR